jgi:hypothetical protein
MLISQKHVNVGVAPVSRRIGFTHSNKDMLQKPDPGGYGEVIATRVPEPIVATAKFFSTPIESSLVPMLPLSVALTCALWRQKSTFQIRALGFREQQARFQK